MAQNKQAVVSTEELKQVKNYFLNFPVWAVWCIVIGVPLLMAYGLGLVLIAGGVLGILFYQKNKTSEETFDEIVNRQEENLFNLAIDKCGLEKSDLKGTPVKISGIRLSNRGGANLLIKLGKDNIIRYTPHDVAIINFTKNYLSIYTCCLDLTTGNALNVTTDEYFYKDIVSVSTETESKTVEHVPQIPWYEKGGLIGQMKQKKKTTITQENTDEWFVLTTSGGTKTRVCLRSNEIIQQCGNGEIPTTDSEKSIAVIRKAVRDKKSA